MKLTDKQDGFKFEIPPQTMFLWSKHQEELKGRVKQLEKENYELSLKYGAAVSEIEARKKDKERFKKLYRTYVDMYTSTVGDRNNLRGNMKDILLSIKDELRWGDAENAIERTINKHIDPALQYINKM